MVRTLHPQSVREQIVEEFQRCLGVACSTYPDGVQLTDAERVVMVSTGRSLLVCHQLRKEFCRFDPSAGSSDVDAD